MGSGFGHCALVRCSICVEHVRGRVEARDRLGLCPLVASQVEMVTTMLSVMPARIGWLGLGNMGMPMVANLVKHGGGIQSVSVFDADGGKRDAALKELSGVRKGVTVSTAVSVRDLVANGRCNVVFSMLPDGAAMNDCVALLTEAGASASPGGLALMVDCSTVHPNDAQRAAAALNKVSVSFVDAPVSGGIQAAKDGTLSFLVGGSVHVLDAARPFLQSMGRKILHCGEQPGLGQAAKLANNLLLGITMAGLCESFVLGSRLGLEPKVLSEVFNASSGRCWSSEKYCPVKGVMSSVPANADYKTGFAARLMLKDLRLAMDAAKARGVDHEGSDSRKLRLPLGEAALEQYVQLASQHPNLDFSALYKYLFDEEGKR
ncbi:3-hydroxyisobutyrate dehydrogenase, mitochondrial [Porphyridium purpureum]|uniref:3-hydroxyisobutyrate dehydrogenase n=1 Tax=Porphyridium purpureum TaxID=35688 RepID=A0A5J4YYG4_PORPP|nr:3-hydroxyisobutyrate dehydrogenase, mitochondrial [Porphyridium purpureum]|eukprot:POR9255..scf209_3